MSTRDERQSWFRDDQHAGYRGLESGAGSSPQDPLTGPMPPVDAEVRASLAEAQEHAARARLEEERVRLEQARVRAEQDRAGTEFATGHSATAHPATGHQDTREPEGHQPYQDVPRQAVPYGSIPHQHLERVPRYTGMAPPSAPAPETAPAPPTAENGPDPGNVASFGPASAPPPAPGTGAEPDAPSSGVPAGNESNTNALPTVAPTAPAPPGYAATPAASAESVPTGHLAQTPPPGPVSGTVAPVGTPFVSPPPANGPHLGNDTEAGIPPSLAPMLTRDDSAYAQHTEPLQRGPAPAGQPGPPVTGQPLPGQPPTGQPAPPRGTNPAVLAAVVLATLLAAVPSVLLLYEAVLASDRISASGAVGGTLMLVGLPLLGAGLAPLIGDPRRPAPDTVRDLVRPPWLYLLTGLVLLLVAGLAVGG